MVTLRSMGLAAGLLVAPAGAFAAGAQTVAPSQEEASRESAAPASAAQSVIALNRRAGELVDITAFGDGFSVYREALARAVDALGTEHPATHIVAANYWQSLNSRAFELLEYQRDREIKNLREIKPLVEEIRRIDARLPARKSPAAIDRIHRYATRIASEGRNREAARLLREAWRLADAVHGAADPRTIAAMGDYAQTISELGQPLEAIGILDEVLRNRRDTLGDAHPETLTALSRYGGALRGLRRYSEAAEIDAQALRLRREALGDDHPQTLESLARLAGDRRALGQTQPALALAEEALQARRRTLGDAHPDTLSSVALRASILIDLERYAESEEALGPLYRDALARHGEDHPETRRALALYGTALARLGRVEEARPLIDRSRDVLRKTLGPDHPETLLRYLEYAELLLDTDDSMAAYRAASAIRTSFTLRTIALWGEEVARTSLRDAERATRQYVDKVFADALWGLEQDRPASSGFAKGRFSPAVQRLSFESLQTASANSTSKAMADAASVRFAQSVGLKALVEERQTALKTWRALSGAFASSQARSGTTGSLRARLRAQIDTLEQRIARIDARLKEEAPQYFSIVSDGWKSLEEVRAVLEPEEAIVLLVPTRQGTHALAVSGDDFRWSRSDRGVEALNRAVEDFRFGLEIEADAGALPLFDLDLAHTLYRELIAPVEEVLEGKRRVYVVADGALSRVPLGTLVTAPVAAGADPDDPDTLRSAAWLADRYALVQLPSVQSLVYIRAYGVAGGADGGAEAGAPPRFQGFGAPVLGGEARLRGARSATLEAIEAARLVGEVRGASGVALMNPDALRQLAALPGTRSELVTVQEALGAPADALHLAERMTEASIRTADLSRTQILHLATHGFTSEESGEAAEPGLVFTPPREASPQDDGYLAASEVLGLDLARAQWIIMSACNTASPSGKPGETGLSGLAQAFFYAGAQSLLVSHWPVFDDIAPRLTLEALKRSQAGEGRAEALQAAMRAIRNDPQLDAAHPAVWAPFTLVGEGR